MQAYKSYSQQLPNPEQTKKLIEGILSPKKNLNRAVLSDSKYMDWISSINQVKNSLKSDIGKNIDTNLKIEFQTAQRREQEQLANKKYVGVMNDLIVEVSEQKASLLKDIKSKKFPLYSKTTQNQYLKESPDFQSKQAGIAELQIANSMPLKHINAEVLKNFYSAGRIDLVSGLIERVAINRSETNTAVWEGVQAFAQKYYQEIGIAEERKMLRKLSVLEDMVINPLASSIDVDGSGVAFGQPKYDQTVGQDNLLEL